MKKKMLLVDENRAIAYLVGTLLKENYETIQVPHARYAMKELFASQAFDLIIVDIDAIDSDNFRLLQHIHTSSLLNTIPVVILSESNSPDLMQACESTGHSCFVKKPFDPVAFIRQVDALTVERSSQQPTNHHFNLFNLHS